MKRETQEAKGRHWDGIWQGVHSQTRTSAAPTVVNNPQAIPVRLGIVAVEHKKRAPVKNPPERAPEYQGHTVNEK
jgi:hypothetical protein